MSNLGINKPKCTSESSFFVSCVKILWHVNDMTINSLLLNMFNLQRV